MSHTPLPGSAERLSLSHERLILDTAHLGTWEMDLTHGRVLWDTSLNHLLQIPPALTPTTPTAWLDFIHPDDRERAARLGRAGLASDEPFDIEYRARCGDGSWLWVADHTVVVSRDAEGRASRLAGVLRDISERKVNEHIQHGMLEFSRFILEDPGREALEQSILDTALKLTELDGGGLYRADAEGNLILHSHQGLDPAFIDTVGFVPAQSPRAELVRAGRLICQYPGADEERMLKGKRLASQGIRAIIVMPLRVQGEYSACLNLARFSAGVIPPAVLNGLETLTTLFTQALERLDAREESELKRRQLDETMGTLERERHFFKTLLRTLPDLVWMKDPEGVYLMANARFEEFFGRPEEAIVGHSDAEFIPAELVEFFRAKDRAAAAAGGPTVNEEAITFADGHQELLETIKTPIYGTDGHLLGVLGIGRDITARRAAEEAVREREALYSATINQAADPIVLIDAHDMRIVDFNQAAYELLGYDREHFANLTLKDINPLFDGYMTRRMRQAVQGEGSADFETLHRHADGSYRNIKVSNRVVHLKGHAYLAALWRDVTEERRAQQALARSNEQLQMAIDGSGIGLWDWYVQSGVVEFNERWAEIVGYTLEELQPISIDTWTSLCFAEDLLLSQRELERHFAGESSHYECELRMHHKAGHTVWVLDRGRVVERGDDGEPVRMAGTHSDITERHAAQTALRESEERFRMLYENTRIGIMVQDAQSGEFLDANPMAYESLGYHSVAELNTIWLDEAPYRREDAAEMLQVTRLHGNQRFEWVVRGAAGELHWTDVSLSLIRLGGEQRILAAYQDITALKQGERLLEVERDFARLNAEELERDQLLTGMLECALRLPSLEAGALFLFAPHEAPRLALAQGFGRPFIQAVARADLTQPFAVQYEGEGLQCRCVPHRACSVDPAWLSREVVVEEGVFSLTVQPIFVRGGVSASLVLGCHRREQVDALTLTALETLASQYGHALERLEVHELTRLERQRREALHQALEWSQELYRATLESIDEGILVIDDRGVMINNNRRLLEMWGISEHTLEVSTTDTLLAHALTQIESPQMTLEAIHHSYTSSETWRDEVRLKDGRLFDRYSSPLAFEGIRARIWSFNDVTEIRRAQAAVQAERDLFVGGPVAVLTWYVDAGWSVEYASPNVEALLGRSAQELMQGSYRYIDSIFPDDRRRVTEEAKAFLASHTETFEQQYRVLLPSGEVRWVYVFTATEQDEGRRLVRLRGYLMDVTEQELNAERLRTSEERYRLLTEMTSDMVFIKYRAPGSAAFRLHWLTGATERLFGLGADEVLARGTLRDFVVAEDLPLFDQYVMCIDEGALHHFDLRVRHMEGAENILAVTVKGLEADTDGGRRLVAGCIDVTEQRRLERELEWADERRRVLLETSRDGIAILGEDYRVVEANSRYAQMLGYPMEEVARLHIWDWDANMDETLIRTRFPQLHLIDATFETRHRRKDGTIYDVEVSTNGTIVGGEPLAFTVCRDITERKEAEARLQEREELFSAIFEQAAVAIELVDVTTWSYVDSNSASQTLLGYTREEMVGMPVRRILYDIQEEAELARVLELVRIDGSVEEWRHRAKDGSLIDALVNLRVVRVHGRELILSAWLDVTERNRIAVELDLHRHHLEGLVTQRTRELEEANQRLRLSDARLQALFELSQRADGMSEQEILQEGLDRAVRLTGSDVGYLYLIEGEPPRAASGLTSGCPIETRECCNLACLQGMWVDELGERGRVVQHGPLDNRLFPTHCLLKRDVVVPVVEEGVVRAVIGVGNKGSEYDPAEVHELQLVADDLWRIVMRRRAEAQLARAKAEAEEASRAKSAFLANMSHEIRTPLNAITGLAYLASRDALEPTLQERMQRITGAVRHLVSIIDDILDISKIEAGKLRLEEREFELDHLLCDLCSLVCERAISKGVQLLFYIDPKVRGRLVGDPLRLGQILVNFVGNAIKFTEQGWVALRVVSLGGDAQRQRLQFEVQDTGLGIAVEERDRLFRAFEQQDASITRRFGGTGLGLAISSRLVAMMGGAVEAEGYPERGSLFTARLALRRVAQAPELPLRGHRCVLVVDSSPQREVLIRQLRDFGAEVDCPENAEALEQLCRAAWADTLIADAHFAPHLQECMVLPLHRLALLGAQERARAKEEEQTLKLAGFNAVLTLPLLPAHLLMQLKALYTGEARQVSEWRDTAVEVQQIGRLADHHSLLLVEDNQINQMVLLELLEHAGLKVELASDGLEAVAKAEANPYTMILMDVQMPRLDGLRAAERIRQLPLHAKTPIIALSANAYEEDRRHAREAGMDDFIAKPVVPEELFSRILKWLPDVELIAGGRPEGEGVVPMGWAHHLHDVDVQVGLRSVQGREELYLRMLERFVTSYPGVEFTLHLWRAGDLTALAAHAHKLKGGAATLGALGLSSLADELHRHLRAVEAGKQARDDGLIESLCSRIDRQWARLVEGIERMLQQRPTRPESSSVANVSVETCHELCAQLHALLRESDMQANATLRDHADAFKVCVGERWGPLRDAIERFDYQTALELLRQSV